MAETYKHGRSVSPLFIDNKNGDEDDLHGITDVGFEVSQGTEDVYIVGQADKCGTEKDIPEGTTPCTQLERGEIQSFLHLANLNAEPSGGLQLTDFSSARTDIFGYVREDERGTIEATVWMPDTAIDSFSLSVDADSRLVRTFSFINENKRVMAGANKYGIHKVFTAGSGVSGSFVMDVSDPAPVVNPHVSGEFILRIDRTRSGTLTTDISTWSYDDGAEEITVTDALADDVYNVYYSAGSFGTGGDPTTVDSDPQCFLKAEYVTVLISDGTTEVELDNITSISFDASISRLNEATVGTTTKIKDIDETPVTISVSGRAKSDFSVEKAFMGTLNSSDLLSDVNSFTENVRVTIKIYDSAAKTTFLLGYQIDNLAFNDDSFAVAANEFATIDLNASTTNVLMTATEGNLT